MRFLTFRHGDGPARPGVLISDNSRVLDLAAASSGKITKMIELVEGGEKMLDLVRTLKAKSLTEHSYALDEVRVETPFRPIQLRSFSVYALHLERSFAAASKNHWSLFRSLFFKLFVKMPPASFFARPAYYKGTVTNFAGPHDDIRRPSFGGMLDYELELAVIIGKKGKDIDSESAYDHVFGYTVYNDVSAREQLMSEMGPVSAGPAKGKDFDTSNIIGPWIVTPDEIDDPMDLKGAVRVNGELRGESSTNLMSHSIKDIIAYASKSETLYPGEMLATGAMPYGCGIEDWKFLEDGDLVELEIERIGKLANKVVA